jgi:hypothetical protein
MQSGMGIPTWDADGGCGAQSLPPKGLASLLEFGVGHAQQYRQKRLPALVRRGNLVRYLL